MEGINLNSEIQLGQKGSVPDPVTLHNNVSHQNVVEPLNIHVSTFMPALEGAASDLGKSLYTFDPSPTALSALFPQLKELFGCYECYKINGVIMELTNVQNIGGTSGGVTVFTPRDVYNNLASTLSNAERLNAIGSAAGAQALDPKGSKSMFYSPAYELTNYKFCNGNHTEKTLTTYPSTEFVLTGVGSAGQGVKMQFFLKVNIEFAYRLRFTTTSTLTSNLHKFKVNASIITRDDTKWVVALGVDTNLQLQGKFILTKPQTIRFIVTDAEEEENTEPITMTLRAGEFSLYSTPTIIFDLQDSRQRYINIPKISIDVGLEYIEGRIEFLEEVALNSVVSEVQSYDSFHKHGKQIRDNFKENPKKFNEIEKYFKSKINV